MKKPRAPSAIAYCAFWVMTAVFPALSGATEPAYCQPETFYKKEIKYPRIDQLYRGRVFRLGSVVIAGLGVGGTPTDETREMAHHYSSAGASENFCTWYLNRGTPEPERFFTHRYVKNPIVFPGVADNYEKVLGPVLADEPISFLSCAENYGYIALGCDGMRHRGPSAFAMLLAFSGCSPKNSVKIVDKLWGTNFVLPSTRVSIAKRAAKIGESNPEARARLQALFTNGN